MTIYNQRDPRWKNQKFGKDATIGKYGCTLTTIAMILDITPDKVAKRLDEVGAFVNGKGGKGNLLDWSKLHEAFPQITYVLRKSPYNNTDVKNNTPCLVVTDFDGNPKTNGQHWVLFIGNKKLWDPWTGTERPTSVYSDLQGYCLIKRKP